MKRRLFIKNATTGVLAATTAALLPTLASGAKAQLQKRQRPRLRATPRAQRRLMTINFKGMSFKASRAQKSAFIRLSPDIRNRLKPPKKGGKVLTARQLNDIAKANAILKAHGEKTMSTIMCPW